MITWGSEPDRFGRSWFPIEIPDFRDEPIPLVPFSPTLAGPGKPIQVFPYHLFDEVSKNEEFFSFLLLGEKSAIVVTSPENVVVLQIESSPLMHMAVLDSYHEYMARFAQGELRASTAVTIWTMWAARFEDIFREIQYHLLEPVVDNGETWQFWKTSAVKRFAAERAAKWVVDSGVIRHQESLAIVEGKSSYELGDGVATLMRLYLEGATPRTSKYELDNFYPGWGAMAPGVPKWFYEKPTGTVNVVPIPAAGGEGSYIYVPGNSVEFGSNAESVIVPVPVPGVFSWGLKYGIMADLLNTQGQGNDSVRAEYCETRFLDSLQLAKLMLGASE